MAIPGYKTSEEARAEKESKKKEWKKRFSGVISSSILEAREELVNELKRYTKLTSVPWSDFYFFCGRLQKKIEEDLSEKLS